ncbi:MAG: c-type cytochrome biogenesis protein CcmI [Alphaproteobacteria bacterium]
MTVWIVFAVMTAAAIFAVLVPLSRRAVSTGGSDLAVYKDQLAEVERDFANGLIGAAEAEAARIEVSRRLLAAAAVAASNNSDGQARRRRIAAIGAIIVVPAIAFGVYGLRGNPDLPGQPLAERLRQAPDGQQVTQLISRIETHLAANPEDGRGWEVLAPVYMQMGRYADAVRARANALRILGVDADREADLAEAMTSLAQGVVTAEAKAGFFRALARDPGHPKAVFFIGLAAEQDGKPADALKIWSDLLAGSPAGAPWIDLLRTEITRLGGTPPQPTQPTPPASGPGSAAGNAIAALPPTEQMQMIRGMVEGLAARLATDGSDFEGWMRLIRAQVVLGETDKARAALSEARRLFAQDAEKIDRLAGLARDLGFGG